MPMGTKNYFTRCRHIAPLAVLRIAFGAVLFISTIRFLAKGWVHDFYIVPLFHFPFYSFGWVHPMGATGMYTIYWVMALAALLILVPANRYCSLDILRKPSLRATQVPAWTILLFKYQLCIVYCCAGLSK